MVNGVPVRDPYPGNIIPANDPLRSIVASRYAALMVRPDRPGVSNNVAGNPAGDQTWELDARNILLRLDHSFSPRFKATFSGYYNNRPSLRNCGGAQGCAVPNDPLTDSASNTEYIGEGFTQRIYTSHAHTQWDWIISNNLMSHSVVAWDRWYMGGASLSCRRELAGEDVGLAAAERPGPRRRGTAADGLRRQHPLQRRRTGLAVLRLREERPLAVLHGPGLDQGQGHLQGRLRVPDAQVPAQGLGRGRRRRQPRLQPARHGRLRRRGQQPRRQTGDPFASFLLGQVHAANQSIFAQPTWYESYFSPWINAEFKVNSKLTVTAGLRLDYQSARTEENDEYSTFDPNTPNPGAGGRPGAVIFAGSGPGRTGSRTFESPAWDAWGPRAGFSYRVNDKTMVRGGYGMYYAGVAFSQFTGDPNLGFASNPSAPNTTNGLFPAFHLDPGSRSDRITQPPFIDPTVANGGGVPAVSPDGLTLPRFQNWSLTIERRLTKNMMLDVSYIGNRGSRLDHHAQRAGLDYNMNDPARAGPGRRAPELEHQLARRPGRRDPALPTRASTEPWPRRCGSIPSTRTSTGGASRSAGASTTPSRSSSSSSSRAGSSTASATPSPS